MVQVVNTRHRKLEAILHEHTELVIAGASLDTVLTQLAHGASELADCPPNLAMIRMPDTGSRAHMRDIWASQPQSSLADAFTKTISNITRSSETLHKPYIRHSEEQPKSALIVPLLGKSTCYGYLCLGNDRPNHFTRHLLPWIEMLAHQAVQTIHSKSVLNYAAPAHEHLLHELQVIVEEIVRDLDLKDTLVEIL